MRNNILKELFNKYGYDINDIKLNLAKITEHNIKKGYTNLSVRSCVYIAKQFNIPINELMECRCRFLKGE